MSIPETWHILAELLIVVAIFIDTLLTVALLVSLKVLYLMFMAIKETQKEHGNVLSYIMQSLRDR